MKTMAQLEYHYGLKIRVYPNYEQKRMIKVNSDASRFVYNQMVGIDQEIYRLSKVKIPIDLVIQRIAQLQQRKNSRQLSNHFQFLNDKSIDSLTKANAIQNYQKAWRQFRKVHRSGTPKFHKKNYCEKYQTNCQYPKQKQAFLNNGTVRFLDKAHVVLPKIGRLRVSGSHNEILNRPGETRIGTVTVFKDNLDRYFVSMQLASDNAFVKIPEKTGKQVGIDLNTDNFLTASDGKVVDNPKYYRKITGKLAKAQRKLSRKARRTKSEGRSLTESKNYQKQRRLVAKIQSKVCHQRKNFLNNLSTTLIKNHDLVVAEELRSSNLLKNHALAMSISDVGWRAFLQMLSYKANLYDKRFITINPSNTTQTCSTCGHVMSGNNKLTLSDRQWDCPKCKTHHVRDHNAAINILNKGLTSIT
ncbi:RNA-guided endonuclease InsQ/TnpB family protein [Lactiplantibacillus modestisalitolerans]|uniref:RNA-guided endonuclease InsQ/TnpB family protein n=2 Tax=Lactiplantibacillus modestisalitolerans TaxID=1457219 RepID=A0ABV5WU00_9LACO